MWTVKGVAVHLIFSHILPLDLTLLNTGHCKPFILASIVTRDLYHCIVPYYIPVWFSMYIFNFFVYKGKSVNRKKPILYALQHQKIYYVIELNWNKN